MSIVFRHVSFTHDGAVSPLFEDINAHFAEGWTGVVGPNGAGKTTLLQLAIGNLQESVGTINRSGHSVFCPQRTDNAPTQLSVLLASDEAIACELRGKLKIDADWLTRWSTLSHGERKRAQIAVALWQQPDVLLLDEPTNHIDLSARELLVKVLESFSGVGLLVSHDRDLLDLLCKQCIILDPPMAIIRSGNYSEASAEIRREEKNLHDRRRLLKQNLERLNNESKRRANSASRSKSKRSKKHLARGDSDGRAKIDLAIVSGQDGQAGRIAKQLDGRIRHVQEQISDIKIKKRYETNFWLEGSVSPRRSLFNIPSGVIELDDDRKLHVPEITMFRDNRIAITGANGLGKSTLVRHILNHIHFPAEHLVYLPQEIDLAETRSIMSDLRQLSNEQFGKVMTVVSALGSRPERLLHNQDVSPGELRKVLLALGVTRRPHLIVMDEPTNHLDLPAIECLENSLKDCPSGLLLISHDLRFLSQVTDTNWHLQQQGNDVTISMDMSCGNI